MESKMAKMVRSVLLLGKKPALLVFLLVLGLVAVYAQTRGLGVIVVRAEYTTYVTVTRERWVPGTSMGVGSGPWGAGHMTGRQGRTETYTVRERVRRDRNLPFVVLEDGEEVFRGRTPVRVTNWDPGVWYTIIWTGRNGNRRESTFIIPTTRPFTRYIQID